MECYFNNKNFCINSIQMTIWNNFNQFEYRKIHVLIIRGWTIKIVLINIYFKQLELNIYVHTYISFCYSSGLKRNI